QARRLLEQDARLPFDLERGPLLRGTVIALKGGGSVLCLCFHHTIFDGWSIDVLQHELIGFYEGFVADRPSPLPALPVQYRDYSEWQRNWLEGGELDRQLTYWRNALGGELPVLELPSDRARPPLHRYDGAIEMAHIPPGLLAAIDSVARGRKSTRFMVLLAAFYALLSRLSGQRDLIVGSPIANRQLPE